MGLCSPKFKELCTAGVNCSKLKNEKKFKFKIIVIHIHNEHLENIFKMENSPESQMYFGLNIFLCRGKLLPLPNPLSLPPLPPPLHPCLSLTGVELQFSVLFFLSTWF